MFRFVRLQEYPWIGFNTMELPRAFHVEINKYRSLEGLQVCKRLAERTDERANERANEQGNVGWELEPRHTLRALTAKYIFLSEAAQGHRARIGS